MLLKEWEEVFKNRFALFAVAFLPLLFTAIPLIILFAVSRSDDLGAISAGDIAPQFADVCSELNQLECNQFVVVTQFLPLFMMLPVIIPITIASYSIVGEKTTRSLESLLATPITTAELLAGKGLAAATPAILASWSGFVIHVIGTNLLWSPSFSIHYG